MRLFCALRVPEETLDRIVEWQAGELRGGRIVSRANLHVTLAFLGPRPAAEVPALVGALRGAVGAVARSAPPVLRALRYRETRSVGMVVLDDEEERAATLAGALFDRLEGLRLYRRERRPWLPHVTVLRFARSPRLRPRVPDLGRFSPSDAALYHSVLRSGGAQYEVLANVALGG